VTIQRDDPRRRSSSIVGNAIPRNRLCDFGRVGHCLRSEIRPRSGAYPWPTPLGLEATTGSKRRGRANVVPVSFASQIAPRLEAQWYRFPADPTAADCSRGRRVPIAAHKVSFSASPFEGRMRAQLTGAWSEHRQPVGRRPVVPDCPTVGRLNHRPFSHNPRLVCGVGFFCNACLRAERHRLSPSGGAIVVQSFAPPTQGLRESSCEVPLGLRVRPVAPRPGAGVFLRRHSPWDERKPVIRSAGG